MITREDVFLAAQTVYGEGRSEPYEGKKAIAHVLLYQGPAFVLQQREIGQ